MMRKLLALSALLALVACREDIAPPSPVAMTPEAVGHFCQMNVLEHPGPKAQIHLKDMPAPLFFSQVSDAIAYQRLPEQDGEITAIYLSDMARAPSWDQPGADNWMAQADAVFVTGSTRKGGMGAPETVPFSDPAAARAFAAEFGGQVVALDEITDDQVLNGAAAAAPDAAPTAGGNDDYLTRLRALQPKERP